MKVTNTEKLPAFGSSPPEWLVTVMTEWKTGWWRWRTTHIKITTWRGHYDLWSNYDTGASPDMTTNMFLMEQHYVLTKGREAQ